MSSNEDQDLKKFFVLNLSKRSREVDDAVYHAKRLRLETHTFQIELIDEVYEPCLIEPFCTDSYMWHHTVHMYFPDYNENLFTAPDDLSKYEPTNVEVLDRGQCNLWKDPVDIKEVVVNTESEIEEINVDRSFGPLSNTYPGQLLWVKYPQYPYWPAIVCMSNEYTPEGQIRVKFFADRGSFGTIKKERVVEFQGIDSFVQYKEAMKSKLNKSDWRARFTLKKRAKAWVRAVVEIIFLLSKDVDIRLALFDVTVIGALREIYKNPPSLSQLISEHSSPSQLDAVKNMYAENSNIFEDVKEKLAEISLTIDTNALTRPTPTRTQTTATKPPIRTKKRHESLPSTLMIQRTSNRLASVVQCPLSVNLPVEPEKPQKCKEKCPERLKPSLIQFEDDLQWYMTEACQKKILFKGLRRGNVCKECLKVDEKLDRDLIKCSGDCADHVHRKCAHTKTGSNEFRCHDCSAHDISSRICYICKEKCLEPALRCTFKKACGRYYHNGCLEVWLQTKKLEPGKVWCPIHTCHTCASDDPQSTPFALSKDSTFSRCIKCPTTYHADSRCIPAGVKILTANQHICLRHCKKTRRSVSLDNCYECGSKGGNLLLCDSCPLTIHSEHVPTKDPDEDHFCNGCENGRHPLHGEVVWTKYSKYRWWPAVVVPPACIPINVKNRVKEHDLCVRFFGTFNFGWLRRSFVYLYGDNDLMDKTPGSGGVKYDEAVEQAEKWYKILKIKQNKWRQQMKPLPYLTIAKIKEVAPAKLTKSRVYDLLPCSCSPNDRDPCGPESNCDKREALTECDARMCPAGKNCKNQQISKREYASFQLKHCGERGFGLIAETAIQPGTLIIEYVGELITEEEYQSRKRSKQTKHYYFMKYGRTLYIDAEKKGNMSRFMNHSCNPNCKPVVIGVKSFERIAIVAIKDIKEGEELTIDYQFNENNECYCGEAQCRGYM